MARSRLTPLATSALAAAACGDSLEPACPPVVRPAVEVEVRDSQTGVFRADSARGVVRDGAYADSLVVVRNHGAQSVPAALGVAFDRPGSYSVRIERGGYQLWDTVGIHVLADRCGAVTVHLVAHLLPAS